MLHGLFGESEEVDWAKGGGVKPDFAAADVSGRHWQKAHDSQRSDAFSRAGLADNTQRLPSRQLKGYRLYSRYPSRPRVKRYR